MKTWFHRMTLGILLCAVAAALPVLAQEDRPQSNDHPEHQKQAQESEHRTQNPAEPHAGTHPAQHNEAHPQTQNRNTNERPHQQTQPNRAERPAQNHAQQDRADQGRRPAQWGKPPAHRGSYRFRSNDRARLHSYYMSQLRGINRADRPVFVVGGYFPYEEIEYLSPLPPDLYGTLPPPPPGYEIGYCDGYVVVYDPVTYFIVSVIDLLQ